MISIEITPAELRLQHARQCLTFMDHQWLIQPSVNDQVGFDFQGLRKSYKDNPDHPDAAFIARFGRVWIYDVALSIYADLKAGRLRQAGYQVGRAMQLALLEEERGYRGGWHFSYNTEGDSFVDPRGPTGANAWCLNAIYAFILATGETSALNWANRVVQRYLFTQQVMDPHDPRYGLIRAGLHNADDLARGDDGMGYRVYEGEANHPYEHVILEHNADVAGTYRLAFRATQRFAPNEKVFLKELIHRHDLLLRGARRAFWRGDHFVTAMDGQGRFYLGTDGQPSVAIDNNTWAAHVFLPYDRELAHASFRYVCDRFLIQTPVAQIEDLPNGSLPWDLKGVYYFPATFLDPFVQVLQEHRPKMEHLFQLEAAFGFILFLKDMADSVQDPEERAGLERLTQELYEHTVILQGLYGPCAAPYASANVPAVFTTLGSVTTAATGLVATSIMSGAGNHDFIGVIPPPEFLVEGRAPLKSAP